MYRTTDLRIIQVWESRTRVHFCCREIEGTADPAHSIPLSSVTLDNTPSRVASKDDDCASFNSRALFSASKVSVLLLSSLF